MYGATSIKEPQTLSNRHILESALPSRNGAAFALESSRGVQVGGGANKTNGLRGDGYAAHVSSSGAGVVDLGPQESTPIEDAMRKAPSYSKSAHVELQPHRQHPSSDSETSAPEWLTYLVSLGSKFFTKDCEFHSCVSSKQMSKQKKSKRIPKRSQRTNLVILEVSRRIQNKERSDQVKLTQSPS